MIDYHVHLWPHGQPDATPTVDELAVYCERAAASGVSEIALTEHLFRFRAAREAVGDFWAEDGADPSLAAVMGAYWEDHARADLDVYVEVVQAAQARLLAGVGHGKSSRARMNPRESRVKR